MIFQVHDMLATIVASEKTPLTLLLSASLFQTQYLVPAFSSVDKTLSCNHCLESYLTIVLCGVLFLKYFSK